MSKKPANFIPQDGYVVVGPDGIFNPGSVESSPELAAERAWLWELVMDGGTVSMKAYVRAKKLKGHRIVRVKITEVKP